MQIDGKNATKQVATGNGQSLRSWISKMSDQIKCALPANITPERMMRIALTAISKDEKLASSTPESFLGALLTSAQLGLECNTPLGQSYLIPFWNGKKQCLETQFQLGYQGLIDLCYRTGQYKTIQARVVYEGDQFDYEYGLDENLTHKPMGKSDKPIAVYAYYQLVNGAKAFEVMTWDQIMAYKNKYSQAAKKGYSSPWDSDPEGMAKKTMLKKVLKYAPKTVEVAEAVSSDTAIITANTIHDGNNISVIKDYDFSSIDAEVVKPAIENKPVETVKVETPKADELSNAALNKAFDNPAKVSAEEEKAIDEAFAKQYQQMEFGELDIF